MTAETGRDTHTHCIRGQTSTLSLQRLLQRSRPLRPTNVPRQHTTLFLAFTYTGRRLPCLPLHDTISFSHSLPYLTHEKYSLNVLLVPAFYERFIPYLHIASTFLTTLCLFFTALTSDRASAQSHFDHSTKIPHHPLSPFNTHSNPSSPPPTSRPTPKPEGISRQSPTQF